jgi:hypothetical protein
MPSARRRFVPRIAAVACLPALLGACGSAVEVTPPGQAGSPLCHKVGARWPDTVAGEEPVQTSSDSPAVHAWGDPAIIARCGVTSPGPTTEQCFTVSGVDWVGQELSDGYKFVTYGRAPAVEVLVPRDYAPEPLVLGAFTRAAKAIPQGPHHCRGPN